uniref:Uncharacterized protein n=1 Tax=viral metagenome TaxID=1070528 RepID=A0A6C0LHE3_9ZZZZ
METQAPLENRLSELIADINTSQFTEQELMDSFLNSGIEESEIDNYIESIDTLINERDTMMNEIYEITRSLEETAIYNAKEYEQQIQLLIITEQNIEEIRQKIIAIKDEKYTKESQVKITTYYQKYYRAWSVYMKLLCFVVLVNIVVVYLTFKGYLPMLVIPILLGISIVGSFVLSSDIRKRDKLIFDEYDWKFDPDNVEMDDFRTGADYVPEPVASSEMEVGARTCAATVAASIEESGGIIQCEEGKEYDDTLFKCVVKPIASEGEVEGFENHLECKTVNMD